MDKYKKTKIVNKNPLIIENASSDEKKEPPGRMVTDSLSGLIMSGSHSASHVGYGPFLEKIRKIAKLVHDPSFWTFYAN